MARRNTDKADWIVSLATLSRWASEWAMMSKLSAAVLGVVLVLAVALGVRFMVFGQARKERLPAPVVDEHSTAHTETAVLAGGCFWGVQTTFERIKGVEKTWAGYSGGTKETAKRGPGAGGRDGVLGRRGAGGAGGDAVA